MKRIWNKQELESADFGKFDEQGNFKPNKLPSFIPRGMLGKSIEWCLNNDFTVKDWMIAKPTKQEPKEGDLVYVLDDDRESYEPTERIFIAKTKYGCVTVDKRDKINYQRGQSYRLILCKNYEPIPKPTAQEIADKVGLSVEELRGIVNG